MNLMLHHRRGFVLTGGILLAVVVAVVVLLAVTTVVLYLTADMIFGMIVRVAFVIVGVCVLGLALVHTLRKNEFTPGSVTGLVLGGVLLAASNSYAMTTVIPPSDAPASTLLSSIQDTLTSYPLAFLVCAGLLAYAYTHPKQTKKIRDRLA